MTDVKFYLEKRKDKKTGDINRANVPINLFYSFNGQRLQYYTGYRIDAIKWNEEKMRVKKNYPEASEINKELTSLESRVDEIHKKAAALGEKLSKNYFKSRLNGNNHSANNGDLIWNYYETYIKGLKTTHTEKTIHNVETTRNTLKKFSKDTRWSLTFDNTGLEFWQEFKDWCFNTKGFYNNYTGTHIDKIKTFLSWAVKEGYSTDTEYLVQPKMQEFIEIIFLEYDEVLHFYNFNFESEKLRRVRDAYCLGCFTGLRYIDIMNLVPANLFQEHIDYRVKKTKNPNIIPLNHYSREILERNKGIHPTNSMPYLGVSEVSVYLKEAMKLAELNRMVQIVHYRGAERFEEVKPLWDAANFHTSKKTFVTNFIQRGGQLNTAMAITGNKSFKTFKRYFKFTDQFKASEMTRIFGR